MNERAPSNSEWVLLKLTKILVKLGMLSMEERTKIWKRYYHRAITK